MTHGFVFFSVVSIVFSCLFCVATAFENDRPIIGVIAAETYGKFAKYGSSYITASYVKFLELAGARVVPIMIHQPTSYYEDLLSKINGALFPGGGDVLRSDGYGRTGKIVYEIAVKTNKKKDYFPLWGTCLGFELLNYLAANKLWMKACAAEDLASPIKLASGYNNSRMFGEIGEPLLNVMQSGNVTINYHQWCLTPQNYSLSGLDKYFKILSLNQDANNVTYVSAIEAYDYPFYGVAFHPEKVLFEWISSKSHHNIPHSYNSARVSQYFANFFVNEARKSAHRFPNKTSEDEALIYNYNPVFTGKLSSNIEQNYYFA